MKKIFNLISIIVIFFFVAMPAKAQNVADQSAKILILEAKNRDSQRMAKRKLAIMRVLERRNSPLTVAVDDFVQTCETYVLDCYLLPAITGLESSFGIHTHPGSYNPFGWGGGYILFNNWGEAIDAVGKGLRNNYINKGAESVDEIAAIYAESETWAPRVKNFMQTFAEEEAKIDSILEQSAVKL